MKLFKVNPDGNGLSQIDLEAFDQEVKLEDWIEANPSDLLGLGDETLLTIGRQVGTAYGPLDVLCLDVDMNPVVVELKKERAPRDVVAQVLEYTTWVASLDYDRVARLAAEYLKCPLADAYWEAFQDDLPVEEDVDGQIAPYNDAALAELFNHSHPRVFVVAGEIPERTRSVAQFLRQHRLEVICLEVKQSLGEDVRVLGVDTVVGSEQKYAGLGSLSGISEEDFLQRVDDELERGELFNYLHEETSKLPHIHVKILKGIVSYRVRIPQVRNKRVIISYAPFLPKGIGCTPRIPTLQLVGVTGERVWQNLNQRFSQVEGGPSWSRCFVNTRQEVDIWLQFIREIWSEIFQ